MRVLIAEDDPGSLLILEMAVAQFDHDCQVAEDGAKAWMLFQNAQFDVVISDWMMPGMDGIELCRRIRAFARPTYTYFIFLTALAHKSDVLTGIEAGADDYLTKPLDAEELQIRLLVASRITALHRQMADQARQLELLNGRLFEQGRTDSLTQLGNRLRLREDLDLIGARVLSDEGQTYCAIICDVDLFKMYNDSYGHPAGDEVLRTVADTIRACCRDGDASYRYGGEEFLIILLEQTLEIATLVAERLRAAVAAREIEHKANAPKQVVTISAGVSLLASGEQKAVAAWLKEADDALYRAKQQGRNQVAVHGQ
ncbi:MAG: diguanylate cyclase domain-containing protein [Gammaproteobacteria bacterium]